MKTNFYLIILLYISSLIVSCSSEDDINYLSDFNNSRAIWLNFKKSSNNSYTYKVTGGSWVGFSWETTITVKNGIVKQRHFKYTSTKGLNNNIPKKDLEWTENTNEIGKHKHQGAEPLTLDQIYDKAEKEWLIKRKNAKTYFEAKNNGLISSCGYVKNNCADDCFIGITIKSIKPLQKK